MSSAFLETACTCRSASLPINARISLSTSYGLLPLFARIDGFVVTPSTG